MATTNITMRMDIDLKNQLQELVSKLGLDMTTFFTMTAKQAVREQALPFRPTLEIPNQETLEAIGEVEYMINHPGTAKVYDSVDALFDDLDSEDDE